MSTARNGRKQGQGMLGGVAWMGASRVVVRLLGVLSTLVLARLLVPEDFGLVAIATSVIGLLETFTELGFNQALIHYRDAEEDDYATAWTLNVSRGILLLLLMLASAYPISLMLDDQRLVALLSVIGLLPLVRGLENPRFIEFDKISRFDIVFRLMVVTKVVGVATTITLAFVWRSYWVLVAGMAVTAVTRTCLTYYFSEPSCRITLSAWRRLMRFSGWLLGAEMLGALNSRIEPVLLAAFAGSRDVGLIHVARELSYTTFNEVAAPLRRVLFPTLSRYSPSQSEFIEAYSQSIAGVFMVLAPLSLGLALTAPDAIPLVLGANWSEAILPIQWYSLALAVSILGRMAQSAVMAVGDTKLFFMRNLIVTPVKLVMFVVGAMQYGLKGAVAASALAIVLETIVNIRMGYRVTGLGISHHVKLVRRSLIPLAVMCLVVGGLFLRLELPVAGTAMHALRLAVMAAAGGLVYAALHYFVWRLAGRPDGPESALLSAASGILRRQ